MYDTILIPADGSEGANEALRHGIDLAERYGSTVHLVYVVDEGVFGHYGGVDAIEHAEEALEEAGEEALRDARERVEAASIPVETHVERTTPHRGIVGTARRVGADLIVMGTEEHSEEYRHLLGSVTERVLRTSSIPVHVVTATTGEAGGVRTRAATTSDVDAIRSIARRSMTASYGAVLDEAEIDEAVDRWYGAAAGEELLADPETLVLLAETDGEPVGFSQSHLVGTPGATVGEIHWLHVDPDHRGAGVGGTLFERTRAAIEERDVDRMRAFVLAEYEPGNAFYRSQGLEPVGARTARIGGRSLEENVYAPAAPDEERAEPAVEPRTTADGETLYVDHGEAEIGSEGPFFAAYRTRDLADRYGWFCSNCGTFDVAMDTMGRIVCNECGNRHKATRWDAVATE
jgi:nucleotide-binding universal stress UspA family protein/ribosomal protein S18 acetylase RimI-like enzyme